MSEILEKTRNGETISQNVNFHWGKKQKLSVHSFLCQENSGKIIFIISRGILPEGMFIKLWTIFIADHEIILWVQEFVLLLLFCFLLFFLGDAGKFEKIGRILNFGQSLMKFLEIHWILLKINRIFRWFPKITKKIPKISE